jgi:hypothetical protein
MNKYVREDISARKLRLSIIDIIHSHFSASKFSITSRKMDIGSFFDTGIDLHWFMISKK